MLSNKPQFSEQVTREQYLSLLAQRMSYKLFFLVYKINYFEVSLKTNSLRKMQEYKFVENYKSN